ncbi:MarR family winged helix-turn-helix transcriptional regulator [Xylanivirga thermophila]|uniref:MarR family winged helix-turn-helix transcriptional regulator n=1 Tax=Xylanivirga thermophila TaxID=2496273 RepID=UPI00101B65BC|nr:MarR family transcriptional regulator [Xylanivirga thermophila]
MEDISLECYNKLMHLSWRIIKQSRKNLANLGFAWNQYTVLKNINPEESITLSELSIRTSKDCSNLTAIVDFLEKKELVKRNVDTRDRRAIRIQLTHKGKKVRKDTISQHEIFIHSLFDNIEDMEIQDFMGSIDIVNDKINL